MLVAEFFIQYKPVWVDDLKSTQKNYFGLGLRLRISHARSPLRN
jgi:hypothetical protein